MVIRFLGWAQLQQTASLTADATAFALVLSLWVNPNLRGWCCVRVVRDTSWEQKTCNLKTLLPVALTISRQVDWRLDQAFLRSVFCLVVFCRYQDSHFMQLFP